MKINLKEWDKNIFGDINKIKERVNTSIRELDPKDEDDYLDQNNKEIRANLFKKLNKLNFQQKALPKQKARINWIAEGDLIQLFFKDMSNGEEHETLLKVSI